MNNSVKCYIFNHNHNENSKLWLDRLTSVGFDAYIIDSGSDEPIDDKRVLKYHNLYYGGCFMEMCRLLKKTDAEWALQINDDILIDEENFEKLIKNIEEVTLDKNIGIYQPSTTEESHNIIPMNINKGGNGMRYTYRIEGWMGLIHRSILDTMYNIGNNNWRDGWGMDLLSSYLSWVMNKAVVVDDRVIVTHPKGKSGYDGSFANQQMIYSLKNNLDMTFGELELKTFNIFKNKLGINKQI